MYASNSTTVCAYAAQEHKLVLGELRLLLTTSDLVLASGSSVLVLFVAHDVIHSWTVPSLAVKVDAMPGRCATVVLQCAATGALYGQCSEICGTLHGFMPILVT
eukprot:TRINITY_DN6215_c0_g4_i9.p1 TRINITY_DN6215_c0_g4~~TRINITY_DN6215_c0_g4_i9.p1  ORF type:complete len:104 (+),score=0.52 TRINITY_DN6215_c0_g4_i9:2-313(+)